jgi:hypothetical protein
VVYDHCSGCMDEQHARRCLVDWGHIVIRWEQLVTPAKMLVLLGELSACEPCSEVMDIM